MKNFSIASVFFGAVVSITSVEADCYYDASSNTADNTCDGDNTGLTCFVFAVTDWSDYDAFKATYSQVPMAILMYSSPLFACSESAEMLASGPEE